MAEENDDIGGSTHRPTWLTGFGCGAMVGVALGIALAPARGHDTRRAIAAATRNGRDRASRLIDRGRRAVHRQHARVDEFAHTAGDQMRGITDNISERAHAVRSAFDRRGRSATGQ